MPRTIPAQTPLAENTKHAILGSRAARRMVC